MARISSTRHALVFSFLLLILTGCTFAQSSKKTEKAEKASSDNPFIVRKVNPNAPCKFAPEYKLIQGNKTDPRVAYIELAKFVNDDQPLTFRYLCDVIAEQTEDTHVLFDKARGFLQLVTGQELVNDALAYFSGTKSNPGVVLYVKRSDTEFHSFVFTYADQKWQNVTERYLGHLHLQKYDYIVVPQYGVTARVLTIDPKADPDAEAGKFHHKMWLRWDGEKFQKVSEKPADWRCPDTYSRYFDANARSQYCR